MDVLIWPGRLPEERKEATEWISVSAKAANKKVPVGPLGVIVTGAGGWVSKNEALGLKNLLFEEGKGLLKQQSYRYGMGQVFGTL